MNLQCARHKSVGSVLGSGKQVQKGETCHYGYIIVENVTLSLSGRSRSSSKCAPRRHVSSSVSNGEWVSAWCDVQQCENAHHFHSKWIYFLPLAHTHTLTCTCICYTRDNIGEQIPKASHLVLKCSLFKRICGLRLRPEWLSTFSERFFRFSRSFSLSRLFSQNGKREAPRFAGFREIYKYANEAKTTIDDLPQNSGI